MNINQLKYKLAEKLPGIDSHIKMAPEHRAEELFKINPNDLNPRLSAVLIILFHEDGKLKIVFIRRSEYAGIHSGQIAFPGGRYEESDKELKTTALREVEEEIGIKTETVDILGHLTDLYIPPSNFMVRAFVGYVNEKPVFNINEREVQEVLVLNYEHFKHPDVIKVREFKTHNSTRLTKAPYFDVEGAIIWGATAMILTELLDLDC
ncbi:putative Nudix hydrolase NudL [bioreactor metagenome]|uniref:Putative Nudix hydrolase NudL n=1 Tax=bioreactor metagenome TaxID=1076179 RepID=A0A644UYX1_9ZZZZ|nr:CoA pyrophosphatase [Paludibacter sp.]